MVTVGSLTPRAKQTLVLLLQGESEKAIANHLEISVHTVHAYVKSIYAHYGVNCRAKLMALWISTLLTSIAEPNDFLQALVQPNGTSETSLKEDQRFPSSTRVAIEQ